MECGDPDRMRVPLDRVLGPIGVRRVAGTVTSVDTGSRTVQAIQRDGTGTALPYDRLVLASGSQVVRPTLPGAEHLFDIDTMTGAAALDAHLRVRGLSDVYAAGDTAAAVSPSEGRVVMQSCQHALPQVKFAGHDVAAGPQAGWPEYQPPEALLAG